MIMKNFGLKFGMIGCLTAAALVVIWGFGLKLGIDLSGGTILVYQIKDSSRTESYKMDDLISALKRRVNPEGVADIPIRKIGNNRIEIILAEATPEEVDMLKRKLTEVGSLEFRILANEKKDGERGRNAVSRAMAANGLKNPPAGYKWAILGESVTGTNPTGNKSHVTDVTKTWVRDRYAGTDVLLTGRDSLGKETSDLVPVLSNTNNTLVLKRDHRLKDVTSYRLDYNPSKIIPGPDAIVRDQPKGNGVTDRYILIRLDRYNVTGELLSRTYPTQDERVQPAVGFVFNSVGARKFGSLTREHVPEEGGAFKYRLAILLDGLVMSAPSLNSEIRDSGIIEGVQPKEVQYLIEILQSGSLPASIDPTPLLEEKIGPTLGKDTIEKGIRAIIVSMLVVPIFMIVYYRFAGVVAVFALVLNMILLLASMAVTNSSFTLPGLAGLALTIGMAVDANVLIFERMREEAERGASMAQQIRNGFSRAWTTILDANVATMLSAAVLWSIGTEEIKGFALTLIFGLIWNLFTAVYVSRVIFDFWYTRGWLRRLTMMKIMDKTNIDFISPRKIFMTCSVIVISLGLINFYVHRNKMFNIDFTGGTLVTIRLNDKDPQLQKLSEGQRAAFVRAEASKVLPDTTVETLNVGSEGRGVRFNIRTTDDNVKRVQAKILETFKTNLARLEVDVSEPIPIKGANSNAAEAKSKTDEKAKADETAKSDSTPTETRFTGGHRFGLKFNRRIEPATVQTALLAALKTAKVTNPESRFEVVEPKTTAAASATGATELIVNTDLDPTDARQRLTVVAATLQNNPDLTFDRLENFGGAVAGETRNLAFLAVVASWLIIIGYVWLRFKSMTYGLAAVIALVHDVLITLGAVSISPYKIDLPMIAAFLTLIGFSVNDTIVIFDRIREIKGKSPYLSPELVNAAVNQTLSRTILTALTAWIVVVILYLFGGEGLQGFSFCLVVGFLSGTYSTVYIASPILIDWMGGPKGAAAKAKPLAAAREV
jgi:SecD/SecF fusion protein